MRNPPIMIISNFVPDELIKLSAHLINEVVRFKLHEIAEMKEGVIRAVDQDGFWIQGGSLCEYLKRASPALLSIPQCNSLKSNVFNGWIDVSEVR